MRAIRLVLAALVGLALVPELARYEAERALYRATGALRNELLAGRGVAPEMLESVVGVGLSASAQVPGDSRGLILAGAARLAERRPDDALALYRRALARGERAEVLFNMGRAHMMRRDLPRAQAAFLRAIWVGPALLAALPVEAATPLGAEVLRLQGELAAGRLAAAPPVPE